MPGVYAVDTHCAGPWWVAACLPCGHTSSCPNADRPTRDARMDAGTLTGTDERVLCGFAALSGWSELKTRDEGRGTRDEGRGTRDEGRRTRDEEAKTKVWLM
jgi:hypothetical protein